MTKRNRKEKLKNVICGKQYTKKDILVGDHCHNHLLVTEDHHTKNVLSRL